MATLAAGKDGMGRTAEISRQSMRAFVDALEQAGELASIAQPVALDYELAACLAEADGGPALRFTAVRGHKMPVVGNLLNSRTRIAAGLGTAPHALQASIISAIERPSTHRIVTSATCQEDVIAKPVLADQLPIPWFFEHEGGPYITAGAIVAKDHSDGRANLSIARLMPIGDNRALVGIAPNHHLAVLARAAQMHGAKLDIAVCIGNHPAVLVASCLYLGLGDDELTIAGSLLGEPLEVARCVQSDLLVPAHCECVLEGTLDAAESVEELVDADMAFHSVIARAAGNSVLASLLESLSTRTLRTRIWRGRDEAGALEGTRSDHRRIHDAIRRRDPELARAMAAVHVANGEAWLAAHLEAGADWPEISAGSEVGTP